MKNMFLFQHCGGLKIVQLSHLSSGKWFAEKHPSMKWAVMNHDSLVIYALCENRPTAEASLNALVNLKLSTLPVS